MTSSVSFFWVISKADEVIAEGSFAIFLMMENDKISLKSASKNYLRVFPLKILIKFKTVQTFSVDELPLLGQSQISFTKRNSISMLITSSGEQEQNPKN